MSHRWNDEIRRKVRSRRRKRSKLKKTIERKIGQIVDLSEKAASPEDLRKYADRLRRLARIAESENTGTGTLQRVRSELREMETEMARELEEANEEAEEVYGPDLSDNDAYYWDEDEDRRYSRRRAKTFDTVEDANEEAEEVYGPDLSDNDAYYRN